MYMHIHTHMHALTHTYKLKRLIMILSTTTNKIPKIYTEKEINGGKIVHYKKNLKKENNRGFEEQ